MKRTIVAGILLVLLFLAVAFIGWLVGLMRAAGFGWVLTLAMLALLFYFAWDAAGDMLKGDSDA